MVARWVAPVVFGSAVDSPWPAVVVRLLVVVIFGSAVNAAVVVCWLASVAFETAVGSLWSTVVVCWLAPVVFGSAVDSFGSGVVRLCSAVVRFRSTIASFESVVVRFSVVDSGCANGLAVGEVGIVVGDGVEVVVGYGVSDEDDGFCLIVNVGFVDTVVVKISVVFPLLAVVNAFRFFPNRPDTVVDSFAVVPESSVAVL